MQLSHILIVLVAACVFAFWAGRRRATRMATVAGRRMLSRPLYHGLLTMMLCLLPGLAVLGVWLAVEARVVDQQIFAAMPADAEQLRTSLIAPSRWYLGPCVLLAALVGAGVGGFIQTPQLSARTHVERVVMALLVCGSTLAIFTTAGIVLSVVFESIRFFQHVPVTDFLFGLDWSPQTSIRAEQVGSSGAFGIVPLFVGTLLISAIAMAVGAPIGLFCAIYLAEYASTRVRTIAKPLLEILAGIPTVVYGFFAALTVAPLLRDSGAALGVSIASESALAAGLVMGLMLIPNVSSLSDDFICSVPQGLRDGSYAVGATRSETITRVVLPAALPGIVGGLLLAASRAIGETMIVVMAAGLTAKAIRLMA